MKFIDETNEQYHARREISASMLKKLDESPRVFEAYYVTQEASSEATDAMRFGTMLHTLLLEPDEFFGRYVVCPSEYSDRRTKAYKEWVAGIGTREVIADADYERLMRCRDAVTRNADALTILEQAAYKEKSFLFRDFLTDVDCRVRFDALAGRLIADIKTTRKCTDEAFRYQIEDFGYDIQAAHYLEGFKTLAPDKDWNFVFIAVETCLPFRCRVFDLDPIDLVNAATRRTALLEEYRMRMQTGDWSDRDEFAVTTISLSSKTRSKVYAV